MLLLVEKFNNQDENSKYNSMETIYLYLNGYNPEYLYRCTVIDNMFIAVLYIITLLISVGAAYLSFSCKWGGMVNNIIIRILFAFAAFMLGPIYLLYYLIFNYFGKLC